jgi:hypothetical protein
LKNITILDVKISTNPAKKPGGKPYQIAEVAFKNNSFNGTVQGKKVTSYSKAYQQVAEAQIGQTYDVTEEKNGEFVEWVSLSPAGVVAAGAAPAASVSESVQRGSTPTRSTYETPEERAIKQVYIVKQSSLSNAVATLAVGAKAVKPSDVLKLAQEYTDFVFGKPGANTATGFDDLPDFPEDFKVE